MNSDLVFKAKYAITKHGVRKAPFELSRFLPHVATDDLAAAFEKALNECKEWETASASPLCPTIVARISAPPLDETDEMITQ